MRLNNLLKQNFKILSLFGIAASWLTIAFIWAGFVSLPFIGFLITGGIFGLAFAGIAS